MSKQQTNNKTKRLTNEIEQLLEWNGIKTDNIAWDKIYRIVDYLSIKEEKGNAETEPDRDNLVG